LIARSHLWVRLGCWGAFLVGRMHNVAFVEIERAIARDPIFLGYCCYLKASSLDLNIKFVASQLSTRRVASIALLDQLIQGAILASRLGHVLSLGDAN